MIVSLSHEVAILRDCNVPKRSIAIHVDDDRDAAFAWLKTPCGPECARGINIMCDWVLETNIACEYWIDNACMDYARRD